MFLAFDLLRQDGFIWLGPPLSERKRDLDRLRRKAGVLPFLSQIETYPDGEVLLDYCNRFGFEGVVSTPTTPAGLRMPSVRARQDE
jgi:ATP-dependent DNA ligase